MGRETMPAIELVRKYQDERGSQLSQFDFVALVDGDEQTGMAAYSDDPEVFVSTLDRPALTLFQGVRESPIRRLGVWGGMLLALSLACFAFNVVRYFRNNEQRVASIDTVQIERIPGEPEV